MLPALALAALALGAPEPAPLWLTFDVVNPETTGGHRILHLEDVIGPGRRDDIPDLPAAAGLLVFSASPGGCGATGLCQQVAQRTEAARARGALVLGVILGTREEAAAAARSVRRAAHPFPVAFDVHGLAARELGLDGPGVFVVIDSEGLNIDRTRPSNGGDRAQVSRSLDGVVATLIDALGRQEEAEQP